MADQENDGKRREARADGSAGLWGPGAEPP